MKYFSTVQKAFRRLSLFGFVFIGMITATATNIVLPFSNVEVVNFEGIGEPNFSVQTQIVKVVDLCAIVNVRVTKTVNEQETLVANANYFVSLGESQYCAITGFDEHTDPEIYAAYHANEVLKVTIDQAVAALISCKTQPDTLKEAEASVYVYPDPVKEQLKLEFSDAKDDFVIYFIHTSQGKLQYGPLTQKIEDNILTVDLPGNLPAGVYRIKAFVDKEMKIIEFTVE